MRVLKKVWITVTPRRGVKFLLNSCSVRRGCDSRRIVVLIAFLIILMITAMTEIFLLQESGTLLESGTVDEEQKITEVIEVDVSETKDTNRQVVEPEVFKHEHIDSTKTNQELEYTLNRLNILNKHASVGNLEKINRGNLRKTPIFDKKSTTLTQVNVSKPETQTIQAPNISATNGFWQNVWGTRYKFFVFSAYYEERYDRKLRIIAVTNLNQRESVWCRMWFANGSHLATERAQLRSISENWGLLYSPFYVFCPMREVKTVPHSVSIMKYLDKPNTNHLLVHNLKKSHNTTNDITMAVCVKPLHYNYDRTMWLIEFLEYYKLIGISHVILYNHTTGAATSCVLNDYERRGFVTILPWQLDVVSQKEIRTEGIFAALNDCLYRTMYRFTHVAMLDFDEFIVPQHDGTLQDLIRRIDPHVGLSLAASYSIRNAFFYLQWPDDIEEAGKEDPFEKNLVVMKKTRRMVNLHPHDIRSKYICRPEFTIEVGNHFVSEADVKYHQMNVPPSDAILNHYRVCEFGGDDCVKHLSVIDRTVYRYRKPLTKQVKLKWNELKNNCQLPDL